MSVAYLCGAQRPRPCRDREAESDRAERAAVVLCGSMYSSAATIRPSARRYGKRPTSTIKSAKLEMMRSLRSTRLVTKPPHLTGRRPPSHDSAEAPRPPRSGLPDTTAVRRTESAAERAESNARRAESAARRARGAAARGAAARGAAARGAAARGAAARGAAKRGAAKRGAAKRGAAKRGAATLSFFSFEAIHPDQK